MKLRKQASHTCGHGNPTISSLNTKPPPNSPQLPPSRVEGKGVLEIACLSKQVNSAAVQLRESNIHFREGFRICLAFASTKAEQDGWQLILLQKPTDSSVFTRKPLS